MKTHQIILFGSYGYTGRLIADACKARKLDVILAGRNTSKLLEQSDQTGYPHETIDLADAKALRSLLRKGQLVIHCGGPFQYTAKQMAEACLETGTHYTDIAGEFQVFELLSKYDAVAKQSGVLLMPGVGFDVVPSDCLAVHLKNRLPGATHLQLAFTMSKGGLSRGTAKTMVEGMGYGGMIRQDSMLTPTTLGDKVITVNFGPFTTNALCIPWGDISTAWRSTGIPNIEVYSGQPDRIIRAAKLSRWLNWLLRKQWVKRYLLKRIDEKHHGPTPAELASGRSYLWGKVWDAHGNTVESRMETLSGYQLTAKTAVLVAEKIISGEVRAGYFTPASYFGEELILNIEGTVMR